MKKTPKKSLFTLSCVALLTSLSMLAACSSTTNGKTLSPLTEQNPSNNTTSSSRPEQDNSTNDKQTNISSDTERDIIINTYKEQISYYMQLAEELRSDLIELKEETYIDECQYKLQIDTLENTIQELKSTVASLMKESPITPSNDLVSQKDIFEYSESGGKVTIAKYIGSERNVDIPSSINGCPVVKIGEGAFSGRSVASVSIPSSVTEIEWFAFSGCVHLEDISIPSSVRSVGYDAFAYCTNLTIICEKGSYIEAYAKSWGINTSAS